MGKLNEDKQPWFLVSGKATDTLGSDTPMKDLRRALRETVEKVTISSSSRELILRIMVTFVNIIRPTYPLFL